MDSPSLAGHCAESCRPFSPRMRLTALTRAVTALSSIGAGSATVQYSPLVGLGESWSWVVQLHWLPLALGDSVCKPDSLPP
jgi:hypothetical protein